MKNAPSLKIIANYAVGYDNIDVNCATKYGIMVTNTPDVLTHATAEIAWALILGVARKIITAHNYTKEGKFKTWAPNLFVGTELYCKTLGIIGAGKIGTQVGIIGKGFGMNILYADLKQNSILEKNGAKRVEIEELLKKSDFITLHVPLTPDTYKLIGEKELSLMRRSSFLINTSRGKVVDEKALVLALTQKRIAGAGLDVYEEEPEVPWELRKLENVVLLPHIGSATKVAREKMTEIAIHNLIAGLDGEVPPNLINPEVLKERNT
jgi:lactate dehydrogenase-like 2-hydroxyacid dehydrogenase